ncbi:hypothetical protein GBF38_017271, partial [Nibea albiflora]
MTNSCGVELSLLVQELCQQLTFYMVTMLVARAALIPQGVWEGSSRTAAVSSSGDAEAVQTVDSFLDVIR